MAANIDNFGIPKSKTLKTKCKELQKATDYRIDSEKPILVHLDGRSFSSLIKRKFKQPFDDDFIRLMNETARYLCDEIDGVRIAYVQSDEISLLITKENPKSNIIFGGRLCKMQSIFASLATSKFNQLAHHYFMKNYIECVGVENLSSDELADFTLELPLYQFDCKVWNVDTMNEVMAWFLYRNIDCTRNSREGAAQYYFPHKELEGLTSIEQIALLLEKKNIDWNQYSEGSKYGRFIHKIMVNKIVTFKDKKTDEEVTTECVRGEWTISDGLDLTFKENRNKFMDLI